jgi:hypothetical protein
MGALRLVNTGFIVYFFRLTNLFLVLDLDQYQRKALDETAKLSHALLDLPYLADIVEEMLLPRYHLGGEEAWSEDALEFLSCCLSGSIEGLLAVRNKLSTLGQELIIQHQFLAQAKPASRLAPRVRFAIEISRVDALKLKRESVN